MKSLKKFKKETSIIIISVICLTTMTLGFSYAVFFDIDSSSTNQNIQTGSLIVEFDSSSSAIVNNNMLPTPDEVGVASGNASTIYLQNNGSLDSNFELTIGYDKTSFFEAADYTSSDKLIPLEFLKLAIFEYNPSSGESTMLGDIVNLADLSPSSGADKSYILYESSIGRSSSGSNAKTYTIKVWLDEYAPSYLSTYKLYLKLGINAGVTEALTDYTINGTLKNTSDAAIANANISIQNGYINTTSDANGNFTITDISEGKYSLKVTDSSGNESYGTFTVLEGSVVGLSKYSQTHTVATGNTLEDIAYTYSTSINNIKKVNNILTNSNESNLTEGSVVIIPNVYRINAGQSSVINNLTIKLEDGLIEQMSLN